MDKKGKELTEYYFTIVEGTTDTYECRCGKKRKQRPKSGFSNLMNHINTSHKNENIETESDRVTKQRYFNVPMSFLTICRKLTHYYSSKTKCVYGWLRWIILEGLPFNTVEKELTREYSSLEPISLSTFMKYMCLVTKNLEKKIMLALPEKFCLIFDGWSLDGQSTHFLGLFACFPASELLNGPVMLAFSPLLDESDMSARSHKKWLKYHLKVFGKSLSNVICFIGDNMPTNQSLANLCGKPLLGCAAHRFNLEVQKFLLPYTNLLNRVHQLMVKLRTLKNSALLREHTNLRPKLLCTTRWTGAFKMVSRYFELKSFVQEIVEEANLVDHMLIPTEERQLQDLLIKMKDLWSVMMKLQDSKIQLHQVRILFNKIMDTYPTMTQYLAKDASIIHNPDFENGLVKLLTYKSNELSDEEKDAIQMFEKDLIREEDSGNLSFAERALLEKPSEEYILPDFVLPTSVIVESCFSIAKHLLPARRMNTTPAHIEEQMFLRYNHFLWDIDVLNHVLNNHDQ